MIRLVVAVVAFDVAILVCASWLLVALLAICVVLCTAAGWAMHVYPRRLVP